MIKEYLNIKNIPSILWGNKSDKLFIAIHGNLSDKEDDNIIILAEEATSKGYQVLSFDLPQHGERINEKCPCNIEAYINDLNMIMSYAQSLSNNINLFACSMGAYFSLLSYVNTSIQKCLFLSPVVNTEEIINNMMNCFDIDELMLKNSKEISLPIGQTLYWDYYCYVKDHPINTWNKPTSILYGLKDDLCEFNIISSFTQTFNCRLKIMDNGEHYFHTTEQLQFFRQWLKVVL